MEILVAEKAGACFGVNRALEMAMHAVEGSTAPVHTLGPLIHNPRVVAQLAENGVAEAADLAQACSGTVVIRSHGTSPQVVEQALEQGFEVVDATCPFVSKVQRTAQEMGAAGRGVVIVGDAGHAEVEGIRAWGGSAVCAVVTDPSQLPDDLPGKVGVVCQTTQSASRFEGVTAALQERGLDVEAHKTICLATQQRQEAAAQLASRVDCMIVLGGRNSGNTKRLAEICAGLCPTHHIEDAQEVDSAWLEGCSLVGITAGASTPQSHIDELVTALQELGGVLK